MSGPRKKVITLRISPEMHAALRKAAHQYYTSMNLLIERACARMFAQDDRPWSQIIPQWTGYEAAEPPGPGGQLCESVNPAGTSPDQICKVAG
jgi:hypothetical protein